MSKNKKHEALRYYAEQSPEVADAWERLRLAVVEDDRIRIGKGSRDLFHALARVEVRAPIANMLISHVKQQERGLVH